MSNKDYNAMYEEKLNKLKQSVLGSSINDQLEMKAISNRKIEKITAAFKNTSGSGLEWEILVPSETVSNISVSPVFSKIYFAFLLEEPMARR